MFDNAGACLGTVVDLFTREWKISLGFRENAFEWFVGFKKIKK